MPNDERSPDFRIDRLGPAEIRSPLILTACGADRALFVREDERCLYDTTGYSWAHTEMPIDVSSINFEVAGPREFIYFDPRKTRAAIVTCGGLCPGINNVIRGLVHILLLQYRIQEVLGIRYGFAGMAPGGHEPMVLSLNEVESIHEHGGTYLGTSRGPQDVGKMLRFLKERGVQVLFAIGGDGTQRGANALAEAAKAAQMELAIVGIPKTIDNDLEYVEKTFGFETAFTVANQVLRAAHAEAKGAYNGLAIVKLMGRHSGYITTLAALANGNVNYCLVPECPFDLEGPKGLLASLEERLERRRHAVIAVAEGAGQDLLQEEAAKLGRDASGNPRLADIGIGLKTAIEAHFARRAVPINVRYIDPSYIIRSTPATANDAVFCLQLAHQAAHAAMSGRTAMLVGLWKNTYIHVPLREVIRGRKQLDPRGSLWMTLLQSTGQPLSLKNT
jgi:6-phosphofructokinase 1